MTIIGIVYIAKKKKQKENKWFVEFMKLNNFNIKTR
jgi:hypothetical protein